MKKILVIEDDANIRESLVELLEMRSYEVASAENGEEGLKLALQSRPDLILCDVMMPGMNGYEVIEKVRGSDTLTTVPFIFLSAKAMEQDILQGKKLGANSYLTKPFRAAELFSVVDDLLNNRRGGNSGLGQLLDNVQILADELFSMMMPRWRMA